MNKYSHQKIEKNWQKYWLAHKTFQTKDSGKKPKKYILDMFPYPSGAGLHVGHPEGYTATDILSRFRRMKGDNVLHPMGWDAFGLPAENYAIKEGVHPQKTTQKNIKRFRQQIQSLGLSYDWSREVNTSSPDYYKWTQWLFLQFYKQGLAYKKEAYVNWCPKDNTVLANEQVADGKCERCGTVVIQKLLSQWFFKITDYAEELLSDLDKLDWPEPIKLMQRNWIGKSQGAEIDFRIKDHEVSIKVFTTRPDTLFGATYMVLAPEHGAIENFKLKIENWDEVQKYIEATKKKSELQRTQLEKEKTGVELKGLKAINPATAQEIPVWIADYVITGYGTGAIMAVPAHDERDFEFAKKFALPIKQVVAPLLVTKEGPLAFHENEPAMERAVVRAVIKHWEKDEYLVLKWLDGDRHAFVSGGAESGELPEQAVLREIKEETGYVDAAVVRPLGAVTVKFFAPLKKQNRLDTQSGFYVELRSGRQIGVAAEEEQKHVCEWLAKEKVSQAIGTGLADPVFWERVAGKEQAAVNYGALIDSGEFTGLKSEDAIEKIGSKFGKLTTKYKLRDWLVSRQRYWGAPIPIIYCEKCGMQPVPEKDLPVKLPTDVDFRPTGESPLKRSKQFRKVACPNCKGAAERDYDTMDTFVDSSWYFLRYTDSKDKKVFAGKQKMHKWLPVDVYVGGAEHAVLHLLYSRFFTKALRDFGYLNFGEPFLKLRNQGLILGPDGEKMSKSRGNVINPDDVVKEFGADSLRMYEMFMGPLEDAKPWQTQGIVGIRRFLDRVWGWGNNKFKDLKTKRLKDSESVTRALHKLIKKITEDIENFSFNTAISSFMEFHNQVKDAEVSVKTVKIFLKLLYPFAPHICEELNQLLGGKKSLQLEPWPVYDPKMIIDATTEFIVQVNGKVRGKIALPTGSGEAAVRQAALAMPAVINSIGGSPVKRAIFVADRLINLVV